MEVPFNFRPIPVTFQSPFKEKELTLDSKLFIKNDKLECELEIKKYLSV